MGERDKMEGQMSLIPVARIEPAIFVIRGQKVFAHDQPLG
jgi:hypothetical protein